MNTSTAGLDWGAVSIIVLVLRFVWDFFKERKSQKQQATLDQSLIDQANVKTAMELRSEMKADRAEARSEYLELKTDFDELKNRFDEVVRELDLYKIGVGLLMGQLIKNGLKPTWTPPGVTDAPDKAQSASSAA